MLYTSLRSLAQKITNEDALCLVASCFQYLASDSRDKSDVLLKKLIEEFKQETKKACSLGDLYIIAGLIKYFGVTTYRTLKVDEIISESMQKNKSTFEKQNALTLVKVLSQTLKKLYEPYLVRLFDKLCEMIADREDKVRETSTKVIKSFMRNVSGYGVRTIMPRLIKGKSTKLIFRSSQHELEE